MTFIDNKYNNTKDGKNMESSFDSDLNITINESFNCLMEDKKTKNKTIHHK